jgi:hypothetical protein
MSRRQVEIAIGPRPLQPFSPASLERLPYHALGVFNIAFNHPAFDRPCILAWSQADTGYDFSRCTGAQ